MEQRAWLLLVLSLSGAQGTVRIRVWRALKGTGAAVLRDGVYMLPESEDRWQRFEEQADAVRTAGGNAYLIPFESSEEDSLAFEALFDRQAEYAQLLERAQAFGEDVRHMEEPDARRRLAKLQRQFQAIFDIDFFPGPARDQAASAIAAAESAYNGRFATGEPKPTRNAIVPRRAADYRGRLWATRAHLWIDRAASAWLIKRFVDPDARFLWFEDASTCPSEAAGFDFDGAEFTHVGDRVTFEVLQESFGLEDDPALCRLAALVHYMDVGGIPPAEAAGLATVLAGARVRLTDDDRFFEEAIGLFDDLYRGYGNAT